MTSTHFDTLRRLLSDILEIPADRITTESSPDTLPGWDSVRHMNLILSIEGEFGIEFSEAEIEQAGDVPAILKLLGAKCG